MQTNSRRGRGDACAIWAAFDRLPLVLGTESLTESKLAQLRKRTIRAGALVGQLEELRTSRAESVAAERNHSLRGTETTHSALQRELSNAREELAHLRSSHAASPTDALERVSPA